MKLVHAVFCICLVTASFDVFLTVNVGGQLHLAQLLTLVLILAACALIVQDGRILWPRGATALSVWVLWQAITIGLGGNLSLSLQFFGLLLFTIAGYFAIVQVYGLSRMVEPLMRAYLWSYILLAAYGLFQFLLPLLTGITAPFTAQWLVHGRVARINGFSYEPSFYSTYMFMGWATLLDLRLSGARIAASRTMKWACWLMGAALILCTSKTGWLVMMLEGLLRAWPALRRNLAGLVPRLDRGRLLIRVPRMRSLLLIAFGSVAAVGLLVTAVMMLPDPTVLLGGTGLGGQAAHSVSERGNETMLTWQSFLDSPLFGYGMGGVPVHIGKLLGVDVQTMAQTREHWGFPVLLDLLAGSGIVGFIPFAVFLWTNSVGTWRLAQRFWPEERAKWLRALSRAMMLEWLLLLSDQNVFRVYLWFHFAMITILAYNLENAPERLAFAAREPSRTFLPTEASA